MKLLELSELVQACTGIIVPFCIQLFKIRHDIYLFNPLTPEFSFKF
jgi:hypothetical protein